MVTRNDKGVSKILKLIRRSRATNNTNSSENEMQTPTQVTPRFIRKKTHAQLLSTLRRPCDLSSLNSYVYLIENGANLSMLDRIAFECAVEKGDMPMVIELVEQVGLDGFSDLEDGTTIATKQGHLDILKYFLARDVDKNLNIDSILYHTAQNGHLHVVQYLMTELANRITQYYINMSMIRAVEENHMAVVTYLLDHGADIHAYRDNAMCVAAECGHLGLVTYLHNRGAKINPVDNYGYASALGEAATNGHLEVVQFLVEHGAIIHAMNEIAVRNAANSGHLSVVEYLVEKGAYIGVYDSSPLFMAASNGHLEVVKFLLKNNVDNRERAMFVATASDRVEIVRYLVGLGVNIRAHNDYVLCKAAQMNSQKVLNFVVYEMPFANVLNDLQFKICLLRKMTHDVGTQIVLIVREFERRCKFVAQLKLELPEVATHFKYRANSLFSEAHIALMGVTSREKLYWDTEDLVSSK